MNLRGAARHNVVNLGAYACIREGLLLKVKLFDAILASGGNLASSHFLSAEP
jgi:hypothetical protein